jgi:hypothetical protein
MMIENSKNIQRQLGKFLWGIDFGIFQNFVPYLRRSLFSQSELLDRK